MFGFDKMFDFNRDGKLSSWERAVQYQFLDEMSGKDRSTSAIGSATQSYDELERIDYEERKAELECAGLDYEGLEMMGYYERRLAISNAGLDPDDYEFL